MLINYCLKYRKMKWFEFVICVGYVIRSEWNGLFSVCVEYSILVFMFSLFNRLKPNWSRCFRALYGRGRSFCKKLCILLSILGSWPDNLTLAPYPIITFDSLLSTGYCARLDAGSSQPTIKSLPRCLTPSPFPHFEPISLSLSLLNSSLLPQSSPAIVPPSVYVAPVSQYLFPLSASQQLITLELIAFYYCV